MHNFWSFTNLSIFSSPLRWLDDSEKLKDVEVESALYTTTVWSRSPAQICQHRRILQLQKNKKYKFFEKIQEVESQIYKKP